MRLAKKVKCVHCQSIVETEGKCTCGKVKLTDDIITEGKLGADYVDVSAKLLNENA